jgi:ABC-type bacteriocin/lantibiotic exporter with double-glycine peptidase domain
MNDTTPIPRELLAGLVSLLAYYGKDVAPRVVAEAMGERWSVAASARVLRQHGLEARVVRVNRGELGNLVLPTLLGLRGGGTVVLLRVGARKAIVDRGDLIESVDLRILDEESSGLALDLTSRLPTEGGLVRRIGRAIAHHRGPVATVLALGVLMSALGVAAATLTRIVVDRALPDGSRNVLAAVTSAAVILTVFHAWFGWIRSEAVRLLDARILAVVARSLVDHGVHLPFRSLQKKSAGELLQAFDSAQLVAQRVVAAVPVIFDAALGIGFLVAICATTPHVAPFAIAAAVARLVAAYGAGGRAAHWQSIALRAEAREHGALLELITGISALKAAGAEKARSAKWLGHLVDGLRADTERRLSTVAYSLASTATLEVVGIALLALGARAIVQGTLSLGEMLQGLELTWAFLGAFGAVAQVCLEQAALRPHVEAVERLLAEPVDDAPREGALSSVEPFSSTAILLDDVWFRHDPGSPWLLKGVTMRIEAGEYRELRGESGAGKTTLLRVIAGLYKPERGEVRIFGNAAARAKHLVTYLPQDAYLFDGSLLDNLRLLSSGAPVDRILGAAQVTGLLAIVNRWPMKLETRIPAGGETLSGGQRQLVVLTACIAAEKPIVLLDESLAHLDVLARAGLAMSELLGGRTVLAITHEDAPRFRDASPSGADMLRRTGQSRAFAVGPADSCTTMVVRP